MMCHCRANIFNNQYAGIWYDNPNTDQSMTLQESGWKTFVQYDSTTSMSLVGIRTVDDSGFMRETGLVTATEADLTDAYFME
jgi:hypothetical protein